MKPPRTIRKKTFLGACLALAFFSLTLATVQANPITLDFNDGLSSFDVDAYPGTEGSGWASGWEYFESPTSITVSTSDPLSAGSGAYLEYSSTGSFHTLSRSYADTPAFNTLSDHTVSWQFRLDEPFSFNDSNDRIQFFANYEPKKSTNGDLSWLIGVAPTLLGSNNWYFFNPGEDASFTPDNVINTGISLQVGRTYDFSVTVHPSTGTYDASISYNSITYRQYGMGYRNQGIMTESTFLQFGAVSYTSPQTASYSLDSISVTGGTSTFTPPQADGFKGVWYGVVMDENLPIDDPDRYSYSGGLGTYPQHIRSVAQYSETANKTFFVYGGTDDENSTLYHCISYYDHTTGQVARPRILANRQTTDAHDNPSMIIDPNGYIYLFSNSHGNHRPYYIQRSTSPYSIDSFETVLTLPAGDYSSTAPTSEKYTSASYSQPMYVEGKGFFLFHTLYGQYGVDGRMISFNTSSDGVNWDYDWETRPVISNLDAGQYQVANVCGQTVGTAFNYHPDGDLGRRTNVYYMQSTDFGQTWTAADGTPITLPNTSVTGAALVHDYESEGLQVYNRDIQYDAEGQPVIFYVTNAFDTKSDEAPHQCHIAHFDDGVWVIKDLFEVDNNYDYGQLTIEDDGTWRIIAPTIAGPQPYFCGGEMATWVSDDEGDTWRMIRQLTYDSDYNHTFAKQPVDASDEFYALWADGNTYEESESYLYFTDKDGTGVWRLPYDMTTDFATPELAYTPIITSIPGDANEDGVVNGSDAAILANNWQATGADWSMGDFNGDGAVNGSDAALLATHWQEGTTPPSTVPEPSTWILLISLLLIAVNNHKRKKTIV